jgi:hypothetical protein
MNEMAPELITHQAAQHAYLVSRGVALLEQIEALRVSATDWRIHADNEDAQADKLRDELRDVIAQREAILEGDQS